MATRPTAIWRSTRRRSPRCARRCAPTATAASRRRPGAVFVEVFSPPRRCFVIGAVHIAQPLAQMLTLADYAVTVIDPRNSFATEARFPGCRAPQEWPDEALERLRPDRALGGRDPDPRPQDRRPGAGRGAALGLLLHRRARLAPHPCRALRAAEGAGLRRRRPRPHSRPRSACRSAAISPAEVAVSIVAQMTRVLRRGEGAEAA